MRRLAHACLYMATVGAVFSLGTVHAAYIGNYTLIGTTRFAWLFAYACLLSLAAYGAGLPDLPNSGYAALGSSIAATLSAAVGISAAQLVLGSQLLPRYVVFWSAAFLIPVYTLCAFVSDAGSRRQQHRDRVLAVVGSAEAALLESDLARKPEVPATLTAIVYPTDALPTTWRPRPLIEAAQTSKANVIVLDRAAQAAEAIVAQAAELHALGVRIRTLSLFYEQWLGKLPVSELERISLMFDIGEIHRIRYGRLKRGMDIVIATMGCLAMVAVAVALLVLNLIANPGPLLYRQVRVGKAGRQFTILKFRTMRPDADSTTWTCKDDPRATRFGSWLRRWHLDELPQFANVLRGDLSIVGPRPEQPHYTEELDGKIPFYGLRHLIRPGVTGWAQVKYPYGSTELDATEKLQYEFYYLRHQSLAMDASAMGRTLRTVLKGEGC